MQIKFENVSYSPSHVDIEGVRRLEKLNFELDGAGFTGIVGDRDSGKTGILYLLSGLLQADRGHIYIAGEDIGSKQYKRGQGQSSCAFVLRNSDAAFFEKTVERELELVLRGEMLEQDEKAARIRSTFARLGLDYDSVSQIAPATLSRSLRYKVSLASALLTVPDVLLLDEPFAQLDAAGRRMFTELVRSLKAEGRHVIATTNEVDFLAEHADNVLVMNKGSLIRSGSPRHIFNDYYDMLRNHIPVPEVKQTVQKLWERDINMPANVVEYGQLVDRLKIIMWRKSR